jgi:hypothetical protein
MEDLFITFIRKSILFIVFSLSFLFSIIINIICLMLVYFVYGVQRFYLYLSSQTGRIINPILHYNLCIQELELHVRSIKH